MASSKTVHKTDSKNVKKQPSFLAKTYLFAYNAVEVVGWGYLLYQLVGYYLRPDGQLSLYDTVKWSLILFQNAAVLEIFHAATGLVPSNPVITTFQVFSRVMVVCGVLMVTNGGRHYLGLPLALTAWSIAEIIRYSYYALNIVNTVPNFLVFLRYTLFIILYPLGVTGELLCFYGAQNEVERTKLWSYELPNTYNFAFDYRYLLIGIMLLYVPLFPLMYLHMFSQRKKILGGGSKKKN